MSLVADGSGAGGVSSEDLKPVLQNAGLELSPPLLDDFSGLMSSFEAAIAALPDDRKMVPRADLARYPRSDVHPPEDDEGGAWATRCVARATKPTNSLLQGRTVALKDNMAFAGVRCLNGTDMVQWEPDIDATIATRIMDAGATITGKATCENCCMEGMSATAFTGRVHNPHAAGYSAGGSSSGSGRLVATGAVDMAIGCDQGGSIRIPAADCGVVGHKPTWGLVPYTGILSLDASLDHAGPMARTVRDAALLLEAIAGPDGWDDRQQQFLDDAKLRFVGPVDEVVATEDPGKMLEGVRVGVLTEGFELEGADPNTLAAVRSAVAKLGDQLGAHVADVSVPLHRQAPLVWRCGLPLSGAREALLGDPHGRKQLHFTDRAELVGPRLTQKQFDALGPGAANLYVGCLWVQEKYGAKLHGRCMNIMKLISDAYDDALKKFDVLVMPTLPFPAVKMPTESYQEYGFLNHMKLTTGLIANTCPFDNSGHPAISLPVGFVPAREDPNVKLPVGMQIVGRKYADVDCFKVAAAWEKAFDWKTM
ncbi:amidase signature enzyme [Xylariaceae sp. FL0804]|nr:amidase signature enzyme [Xylariaceae sp. FL0804]